MDSALLVSSSEKGSKTLKAMMEQLPFSRIVTAGSGSEARRSLSAGEYSVVVINAPLQGELGQELALWIAENTSFGVVLLLRQEQADEFGPLLEERGVLTLGKPLNTSVFLRALRVMLTAQNHLNELRRQNRKLQDKLEEMRLVDRAKCALIEKRHLTEAQAHRFIEKQAMDHRVTRREVAREILDTIE